MSQDNGSIDLNSILTANYLVDIYMSKATVFGSRWCCLGFTIQWIKITSLTKNKNKTKHTALDIQYDYRVFVFFSSYMDSFFVCFLQSLQMKIQLKSFLYLCQVNCKSVILFFGTWCVPGPVTCDNLKHISPLARRLSACFQSLFRSEPSYWIPTSCLALDGILKLEHRDSSLGVCVCRDVRCVLIEFELVGNS